MAHVSAWMGAGAIAAGISAAMIAGADVASADTAAESDRTKARTSASSSGDSDRNGPRRSRIADERSSGAEARDRTKKDADDTDTKTDSADDTDTDDDTETDDTDTDGTDIKTDTDEADSDDEPPRDAVDPEDGTGSAGSGETVEDAEVPPVSDGVEVPAQVEPTEPAPTSPDEEQVVSPAEEPVAALAGRIDTATEAKSTAALTSTAATAFVAAPQLQPVLDLIQGFIFDVVGVAVTFIAGPPVVPAGSTVTVRTSSLEITEGRYVPAHWYYPAGDEPPQRIIYLQHGFLGVGAMYSYTAANLAQSTNSIVVVPTLTSNRYVRDGFWLGSDQALRATAELLLGDREALTASAIAAGYAQRYGAGVPLPGKFALVGHSLGGNLVAGAAGYYADAVIASGAVNQLAGVVLLDAAPQLNVLSDALDKLDGLGTYIPVLELGAPKESRRVDAALNEHRPGKFNGVVLENGKHLDAMQGGTWAIQLISHLYQGFPTAQNQAAAQTLIDGWVADILDGRIDPATGRCDGDECAGIYGNPGQTLALETPAGPTRGTVIGVPLPARSAEFRPWSVTAPVAPRPPAGSGPLLRV